MDKIIIVSVKFNAGIKKISGFETVVVDNSKDNRGFAVGANIGIKEALKKGADKVILVNPDIKITRKDITDLLRINTDIVAPVLKFKREGKFIYDFGGKVNWLMGRTTHIEQLAVSGERLDKIDYVSGACMMVDRKVFEKIGYFDEQFFMYFEDVDFCLRAKAAGFKISVADVVVDHDLEIHKNSGNWQKMKYLLASNLKFINKWIPIQNRGFAYGYWLILLLKSISRRES